MAKFRQAPPEQAPEHLTRFCAAEWPGLPAGEAIGAWHEARMAWHEDHCVIAADKAHESALGTYVDLYRDLRQARMASCEPGPDLHLVQ